MLALTTITFITLPIQVAQAVTAARGVWLVCGQHPLLIRSTV